MPSFVEISTLFNPPKLGTSLGQKVSCIDMCKILFLFLIWETSSKAPFRTYCQYSYFLHLFFSLLCGRRAQRRPFGLIASTLMFSIFSFSFSFSLFFFYFAHIVVFGIPFYSI